MRKLNDNGDHIFIRIPFAIISFVYESIRCDWITRVYPWQHLRPWMFCVNYLLFGSHLFCLPKYSLWLPNSWYGSVRNNKNTPCSRIRLGMRWLNVIYIKLVSENKTLNNSEYYFRFFILFCLIRLNNTYVTTLQLELHTLLTINQNY